MPVNDCKGLSYIDEATDVRYPCRELCTLSRVTSACRAYCSEYLECVSRTPAIPSVSTSLTTRNVLLQASPTSSSRQALPILTGILLAVIFCIILLIIIMAVLRIQRRVRRRRGDSGRGEEVPCGREKMEMHSMQVPQEDAAEQISFVESPVAVEGGAPDVAFPLASSAPLPPAVAIEQGSLASRVSTRLSIEESFDENRPHLDLSEDPMLSKTEIIKPGISGAAKDKTKDLPAKEESKENEPEISMYLDKFIPKLECIAYVEKFVITNDKILEVYVNNRREEQMEETRREVVQAAALPEDKVKVIVLHGMAPFVPYSSVNG